jgi:hypothetical protein
MAIKKIKYIKKLPSPPVVPRVVSKPVTKGTFISDSSIGEEDINKTIEGFKLPNTSVSKSTIDVKDYTKLYQIRKTSNNRGNFILELVDLSISEIVYKVICKSASSFKNQVKYVNRTYGKRNIKPSISELFKDFLYTSSPVNPDEAIKVKKIMNKPTLKVPVKPSVNVLKKTTIENVFKQVATYLSKDANIKIKHGSSSYVTAYVTSEDIAEGEHKIEVDYTTKAAKYYFNGKFIKSRKNLKYLLK